MCRVHRGQPSIYLHIGPPKTGTTYLQDVVWRNRQRLRRAGVSLPGSRSTDHFHAALDLRDIQFGGYDNPEAHGAWPRLVAETARAGTAKALISHELLAGATPDEIARLARDLASHELHVICGARDLARQLPAVWQESLKNRRSRTFDAFLATTLRRAHHDRDVAVFWRGQDTVRTLERWSAVVSPDRIHVVTLPQSGAAAPQPLWSRFAQALGIAPDGFDLDVLRSNPSLSQESAEVLRRLNQALPEDMSWPAYARLVKRRFAVRAQALQGGSRLRLPIKHREELMVRSMEIRTGLARGGFDVIGELDDLIPVDSAFTAETGPTPDMVTDAAVRLLAATITDVPHRRTIDTRERAKTLMDQIRRGRS